jgi:2-oxoisovalerate dehydrogenase E1 component
MSIGAGTKSLTKLDYLRLMMLSREGDRREGILLRQSKGWFQVSGMGHEALAALNAPLRKDDYIFPYYRDRALMLARGLTNEELASAYFAKADSSSAGRQMPGHYSSRRHNVFSVATPTGSSLLPATGTAWGMKLENKDSVVLATVGDAAMRQGEFYEALSFAVQEKLPVIIVVEDNKYGISTATEKFLPFNLGGIVHEQHLVKIDGRKLDNVLQIANESVERARKGEGPTLVWADIDRLSSHTSSDDHRVYRSLEDIEAMEKRDPIRLLSEELMESGELTEDDFGQIKADVKDEIDRAYRDAEKKPDPKPEDVLDHTWGEPAKLEKPPLEPGKQTMVEAINRTFRKMAEVDHKTIFFGEDIEDPKGGVFGLTKGISENYPKQAFNSPLAEATIVGVGVGLAAYGMRPVFELQFIDFVAPAWNQITTNLSTLRWRTNGDWECPLVIYAPYGAYLPGGSLWHSQANEASIAHNPGIKVAIPSTPEDAAGLFWTAMHGNDPAFILVPKHIFRKRVETENVEPVPFGKARVVQEGDDITVVTYGNTLELAHEAADKLDEDASVEIIDLRSIVPCDYETIEKSLEKTGRLVVIQEDIRTCGFGQAVISEVTSDPDRFNLLLAPPQLVAREDAHIGYNPIYEYAALPDVEQVLSAMKRVLE